MYSYSRYPGPDWPFPAKSTTIHRFWLPVCCIDASCSASRMFKQSAFFSPAAFGQVLDAEGEKSSLFSTTTLVKRHVAISSSSNCNNLSNITRGKLTIETCFPPDRRAQMVQRYPRGPFMASTRMFILYQTQWCPLHSAENLTPRDMKTTWTSLDKLLGTRLRHGYTLLIRSPFGGICGTNVVTTRSSGRTLSEPFHQ
jgi:hypothetical protein